MALINIKIEGKSYQVEDNLTVLQACRKCGYQIPSLCTWKDGQCSLASCRVCLVEVKGARGLVASCAAPVNEGMEISISSPKAVEARRTSVELLLSNHQRDCLQCEKNGHCELLEVSKMVGAREGVFLGEKTPATLDEVAPGIIRNTGKCILCGRCIEACKSIQGIGILGFENRGLLEHSEIDLVDKAMKEGKFVVCQVAPAVRATIAEEFGEKIGTNGTKKMIAALHRLGFSRVFDVNFGADLTIMEEGSELLERIKEGGVLPQITSCSPGWMNYMEYYYPEVIPNVSTCKSPHQMQGAITKSYFAKAHNLDPKDIFVVSIMPCTAKKYEKSRKEMEVDGYRDIDAVLTTRELAKMIKRCGIDWKKLPEDEEWDQDLLGQYSGAGVIFGVTGGVMEAALRTAYFYLTGKEHEKIDFEAVRGLQGVREASIDINGTTLRVAIASGMRNAKVLLDDVKAGKSPYAFIEIMGCPGGCINGGGQPYVKPMFLPNEEEDILETYRQKRASVLYQEDVNQPVRQSHNNPDIKKIYADFLGKPLSELSEKLLHTHYDSKRERFPAKK